MFRKSCYRERLHVAIELFFVECWIDATYFKEFSFAVEEMFETQMLEESDIFGEADVLAAAKF